MDAVAARRPADQKSDMALFSADLDVGNSASREEEEESEAESEDPVLLLKEAMSQSH